MARLLSGRVKVTPPTGVSTDRYSYLKLQDAEPNAGVPGVDGYVLASDTSGNRFWRSSPGASAINGITVKDNGVVVGTASSVGSLDFVSPNFTATASGAGATITFNDSPTFTDLTVSGVSTFQSNVNLGDNDRLRFGDNQDLQIWHSGGGSFIDNTIGSLYIRDNGFGAIYLQPTSGEESVTANANGSVELYYDNSKKFETTGAGVTITGIATAATFYAQGGTYAAGTDTVTDAALVLEGENSIYVAENGGDFIRNLIGRVSNNINIGQQDTSFIGGIDLKPGNSGSVKLHDGATTDNVKLETTGYGVTVTGTLFTNELTVSGVATISGLKYPTTDGTANQVVATDGNGNLSLQTLSDLEGFNWETVEQDFGLITESVNDSPDNGLITDSAANSYDLGFIVTSGLIYPTQFVLPSFTVSTLPSVNPAGQMLLVTDETGGSVPAFSDGTNWRRVTDRAIVS